MNENELEYVSSHTVIISSPLSHEIVSFFAVFFL